MWKWLCSWFAWRFSLTRLMMATMLLAALLGLNSRVVQGELVIWETERVIVSRGDPVWGWPAPFIQGDRKHELVPPISGVLLNPPASADVLPPSDAGAAAMYPPSAAVDLEQMPWTHKTYQLLMYDADWQLSQSTPGKTFVFSGIIINAVFALAALALILFLQIPRRKAAARAGE